VRASVDPQNDNGSPEFSGQALPGCCISFLTINSPGDDQAR
jgi:hypothetical protein